MSLALRTARVGLAPVLPRLSVLAFHKNLSIDALDLVLEHSVWTIAPLTLSPVLSISTELHRFQVNATFEQEGIEASDYDLEIAHFTSRSVALSALVWKPLSWNADNGHAEILIGPDSEDEFELAPGAYYRAIRTVKKPRITVGLPYLMVIAPAAA